MELDGDRPVLTDGDPAAVFGRLFEDYARPLHRYLARRTDESTADDLVAETFLVAMRRRHSYDPQRAVVRSWLYGIATNLLSSHIRTELRGLHATARMAVASAADTGDHDNRIAEKVDAQGKTAQLAGALAKLKPIDRDTLLLTAWGGLDTSEVAEALNVPVGTVRSRLHRARRQLRKEAPKQATMDTSSEVKRDA